VPDWTLQLRATGQQELVAGLKQVTRELNDQERATERQQKRTDALGKIRQKLNELAKQERKEVFDRLSTEEKLLKLEQQRERLQERMVRAQGNAYRTAALQLRMAQTNASIRGLQGGGEKGEGMLGRLGEVGAVVGRFFPAVAGLMGVASIFEKLKGTLERAKETSDIAQQLNLGTRDIAGVQAAGRRIKNWRAGARGRFVVA
jgi:chromosome segregation ATPase